MSSTFPNFHPPYAVVPLLDRNECQQIIDSAEESQRFQMAQVMRQDGKVGSDNRYCTAELAVFRSSHYIYDHVLSKVRDSLNLINARYEYDLFQTADLGFMPHVNVLRYDAANAGKFEQHVDMAGRPEVRFRKLSVVVPLNDPATYGGGRLIINTGEQFDAFANIQVGEAVVFSSLTMHGVTPVLQGTRYVLVFFIQGPSFR